MTMRSEHTTDPGGKSAAEIEREVRQQRADVERTLDAIQERLSPGQLVDQAMTYLRQGGGAEFVGNLGHSVKQNPLPVALIGVGVAWMMAASARRNGDPGRSYWAEAYDEYEEYDELEDLDTYDSSAYGAGDYPYAATPPGTASSAGLNEAGPGATINPATGAFTASEDEWSREDEGPGLGERARAAAAGARDKADELRRRARDAASDAKASVGELGEKARAGMARAGRTMSAGAGRSRSYARQYGRRARQSFVHTLNEQPLVLGAIGLAVGAALGSALPSTTREDRLMGDTRDRLKRRATEVGREQMARAEAAAGAAYEAGRDEAERQGLTPEGGKSALDAAREKVERVAEAATAAGKDEAERQGLVKGIGGSASSEASTRP
jgi:hypothetical protein